MTVQARFQVFTCLICAATAVADQTAPIPARDALGMFRVPDDVRVELVAAEPDVIDPVALCFDERGRMFVVENRGYPTDDSGKGVIAMLEDPDGDGYYEKRTVFADGFDFPNGVMPWKGGIIVTCAPDLLYLKDVDGDGRADTREVLLTGFAPGGSTQLRVSHPMLGIDNWIYLTNGLSGGEIANPSKPELPPVKMGSLDGRYNPLTGVFETTAGQAQFGQAFDDLGNKYVCSNRKHIEHIVLQPGDLARNPHANLSQTVAQIPDHGEAGRIFALNEARTTAYAHAGTFTAACGIVIYRGDAMPAYLGNAFVCDPTAALIHRDILEPHGATFIAKRGEENKDFLATPDNWCRPVFLANGPDGALYMCDMYRATIEHPVYLPEEIRGFADFEGGKDCGRIYRIIGKDVKRDSQTVDETRFVHQLDSGNGWVSDTAQRLLLEKGDLSPLAFTDARPGPARLIKTLYLEQSLGKPGESLFANVRSPFPWVREHALRVARTSVNDRAKLADLALPLIHDPDARVRFVAALALGDAQDPRGTVALAEFAARAIDDEWNTAAAFSSAAYDFGTFATECMKHVDKNSASLPAFAESLAQTLAAAQSLDATRAFLETVYSNDEQAKPWQVAALRGALQGSLKNNAFDASLSALERINTCAGGNAALTHRIAGAIENAKKLAGDATVKEEVRVHAVALLGYTNFEASGALLGELVGPIAPPEVQLAAVQALARMHDDRVAQFLASDAWGGFTAPVRSAAASALLATPQRTLALLDGIERGAIPAWIIDPGTRGNLQEHRDEAIRTKARALFAEVKSVDRKKVYEEYKDSLELAPKSSSGAQVYKDLCAQCHVFNGTGFAVGPDLTSIRSQPNEAILMHILMPNWILEQGFENYTIETADLETYSGIIKAQDESSITLKCPQGIEKTIARADISSIKTASKSLMPEELEKGMTKQQLRDLIGYLKGE
ncbi:MAG: c-type cytochrome [Candidatus Hydrogenedentes bacterium]|nr:c-type cytochrome [Candidatus Hydrogenedentota bacterium]